MLNEDTPDIPAPGPTPAHNPLATPVSPANTECSADAAAPSSTPVSGAASSAPSTSPIPAFVPPSGVHSLGESYSSTTAPLGNVASPTTGANSTTEAAPVAAPLAAPTNAPIGTNATSLSPAPSPSPSPAYFPPGTTGPAQPYAHPRTTGPAQPYAPPGPHSPSNPYVSQPPSPNGPGPYPGVVGTLPSNALPRQTPKWPFVLLFGFLGVGFMALIALVLLFTFGIEVWEKVDVPEHEETFSLIEVPTGATIVEQEESSLKVCHVGQNWIDCVNAHIDNYNYACVNRNLTASSYALCTNYEQAIDEAKSQPLGDDAYVTDPGSWRKFTIRDEYRTEEVSNNDYQPPITHDAVCILGTFGECPTDTERQGLDKNGRLAHHDKDGRAA